MFSTSPFAAGKARSASTLSPRGGSSNGTRPGVRPGWFRLTCSRLASNSSSPLMLRALSFFSVTATVPPGPTWGVTSSLSVASSGLGAALLAGAGTAAPVAGPTPSRASRLSRVENAPGLASVPPASRVSEASGTARLRTTRGVISSTTSVLLRVSVCVPNSRPSTGRRDSPGMPTALLRSSSLMRPASTCVSPSARRSVVEVLRVPIS
mmetsp:Transcript_17034/g.40650  ORF Transcript_17034/g.40650 Transcript_17034/m.40650 type:complete len:209 (-) Transcript_17034:847-1473(-)